MQPSADIINATNLTVEALLLTATTAPELAASVRASLARLTVNGGQPLSPQQLNRAAQALERAARQLVQSAVHSPANDAGVAAARHAAQMTAGQPGVQVLDTPLAHNPAQPSGGAS